MLSRTTDVNIRQEAYQFVILITLLLHIYIRDEEEEEKKRYII